MGVLKKAVTWMIVIAIFFIMNALAERTQQTDIVQNKGKTEIYSSEVEMQQEITVNPMIRVLLMPSEQTKLFHEKITIMSDQAWHIQKDNTVYSMEAGQCQTIDADDLETGSYCDIYAEHEGCIQILTSVKNHGFPEYTGIIRIYSEKEGLVVVNILDIESYIAGVVPSEMPSRMPIEALKAQAVCARTYAAYTALNPKYRWADLDDSTGSQVYMNQACTEKTDHAVSATKGIVITCSGHIMPVKYFSTSCGLLSSEEEVWMDANNSEIMTHRVAGLDKVKPDMSQESTFRQFIMEPEESLIEYHEPWFRWQCQIKVEDIRRACEQYLTQRQEKNPGRIKVISIDGQMNLNDIQSLVIEKRADSGLVQQIALKGDEQTIIIQGEYNIRRLLSDGNNLKIRLKNEEIRENLTLLPSAYFYIEEMVLNGQITGYTLYGGGFGHGAGMSQNGASVLANKGWTYDEILEYYFSNISLGNLVYEE